MVTKKIDGRCHTWCKCDHCAESFWKRTSFVYPVNFCSTSCKAAGQRRGTTVSCAQCGTPTYVIPSQRQRTERTFCGRTCRAEYYNPLIKGDLHPNWNGGKASYRQRALKHYGAYCHALDCPVTAAGISVPEKMLDVDHRDGDRSNNKLPNLQVICVWCHSLKTRAAWG